MRKVFLLLCFTMGVRGSAETSSEQQKKCEQAALDFCLKNMRVLESKRDMRLFHWFTDKHFVGKKPMDYIDDTLKSFGNTGSGDQGMAGTSGLYLATDPIRSCGYGKGDFSRLAVLNIPKGTRTGYLNVRSSFSAIGCDAFIWYEKAVMGKCVEQKKLSMVAYPYGEWKAAGKYREEFFGNEVAFTLGDSLKANPAFVTRVYDWVSLSKKKTKEAAVIRREILRAKSFWDSVCLEGRVPGFGKDPYPDADLDAWAKKYLLNHNDSKVFFKILSPDAGPSEGAAASIVTSEEKRHE